MLEIKTALNGWILTRKSDQPDVPDDVELFSYSTKYEEIEVFKPLLYSIKDAIGPMESRYDDRRIYCIIRPGDKSEKFTESDSKAIWGEVTEL